MILHFFTMVHLSRFFNPLSLHHASYVGLYLLLGGAGVYAPVPDELTLLTAGYLIARGAMSPFIVIPVSILAALVVDSVLYLLARTGSRYAVRLRDRTIAKTLDHTYFFSPSHPMRTVFFLRFIVGLRIMGPLFAGFSKMSYGRFALATLANLIVFFPFVLALGYIFHNSLPQLIHIFRLIHVSLLYGVIAVAVVIILYVIFRHIFRKK